ncbi:MAG: hypothetical protein EXS40_01760 [Opitutaceae bacterium]|nr:hypothetical protein [Opitutaceae bacterium]
MAAPSIRVVDEQPINVSFLKRTLEREDVRSIPVIFVTARTTTESKRDGLSMGAVGYTHPI